MRGRTHSATLPKEMARRAARLPGDLFAHTLAGWPTAPVSPIPRRDRGTQALLFEDVLGTLGELSATQPLVVVLEDLHWADRSTLDLFAFVATHARRQRLLLVGTYRDAPRHGRHPLDLLLLSLERRPGVISMTLPALDPSEIRTQIDAIAGGAICRRTRRPQSPNGPKATRCSPRSFWRPAERGPLPASVRDALLDRSSFFPTRRASFRASSPSPAVASATTCCRASPTSTNRSSRAAFARSSILVSSRSKATHIGFATHCSRRPSTRTSCLVSAAGSMRESRTPSSRPPPGAPIPSGWLRSRITGTQRVTQLRARRLGGRGTRRA